MENHIILFHPKTIIASFLHVMEFIRKIFIDLYSNMSRLTFLFEILMLYSP